MAAGLLILRQTAKAWQLILDMKFYGWTKERGLELERKRTCIAVQRMKVTRRTLSWYHLEPRLRYSSIDFLNYAVGILKIDVKWRYPGLVKMIGDPCL